MNKLPTNNLAVISAVCGVLGIIGVLPLIGSLIAIVTGHPARREIAAASQPQDGAGLATLGLITGYLALGLVCMGTLISVAVAVLMFGGSIMAMLVAMLTMISG